MLNLSVSVCKIPVKLHIKVKKIEIDILKITVYRFFQK